MRKLIVSLVVVAVAVLLGFGMRAGEAKKGIPTLIVTGDDVGAHPWKETSAALRKILEGTGKFQVYVCEDANILESKTALKKYDLIVLDYYNASQPTLSDEAKANLVEFVKSGKGFVPFHLTSAAFKEWDEFHKMCGRWWVMGQSGHGPRGKFEAKVANREHPITKGLESFRCDDELYSKLLGDAPIDVLVNAYSDFSKKVEPLAFTLTYGQGRVYHHAFGHDGKACLEPPEVAKLFARGAEWAATGKAE